MIFNVPYLIHYVSSRMSLDYGDIILTGTPEGVGPVSAGQVRHAVQLQCSVPLFALLIHFAPPFLSPTGY